MIMKKGPPSRTELTTKNARKGVERFSARRMVQRFAGIRTYHDQRRPRSQNELRKGSLILVLAWTAGATSRVSSKNQDRRAGICSSSRTNISGVILKCCGLPRESGGVSLEPFLSALRWALAR